VLVVLQHEAEVARVERLAAERTEQMILAGRLQKGRRLFHGAQFLSRPGWSGATSSRKQSPAPLGTPASRMIWASATRLSALSIDSGEQHRPVGVDVLDLDRVAAGVRHRPSFAPGELRRADPPDPSARCDCKAGGRRGSTGASGRAAAGRGSPLRKPSISSN
jgi:hypothetical protein